MVLWARPSVFSWKQFISLQSHSWPQKVCGGGIYELMLSPQPSRKPEHVRMPDPSSAEPTELSSAHKVSFSR